MGHFYMENICTMDEQRKCELKIIAGKIGWILLIAYLGSLILMRIMPIFAENMAFIYLGWYRMGGNEKMGKVVFAGYMLF